MRTGWREGTYGALVVGVVLAGAVVAALLVHRSVGGGPLVDLASARSWPPVATCLDLGRFPVGALVDCDEDHDAEVVGTVVIAPRGTPSPDPGDPILRPADGCAGVPPARPGVALRHLGVQLSDWKIQSAGGPVLALCVAEPLPGGSVRGGAR